MHRQYASARAAASRITFSLLTAYRLPLTAHVLLLASILSPLSAQQPINAPTRFLKLAHTYSIVAYDSATGDLGVAVQSKFPNVGGIVPWARAGVGAVATQSLGNTAYGERGLDLIALGATAEEALRIVMRTDTMLQDRQVGMVDAHGNAASFTGRTTFDWAGGRTGAPSGHGNVSGGKGEVIVGHGFTTQANIMVSDQTVKNLAETFERSRGSLADRLMAALKAGQAGGGDKRGMQSAALLVVRRTAATSALTTGSSTSGSTTRRTRSPSWRGCSHCTSCTSSPASRRTCCRSPRPWWPSSSRSCSRSRRVSPRSGWRGPRARRRRRSWRR